MPIGMSLIVAFGALVCLTNIDAYEKLWGELIFFDMFEMKKVCVKWLSNVCLIMILLVALTLTHCP